MTNNLNETLLARVKKLENEAKAFRAFLDHMNLEVNYIVFKAKYKYTKVGQNGAVERCN